MTLDLNALTEMRAQIDEAIRDCMIRHAGGDAERMLIDQAAEQLSAMTGRGGSARAYGEGKIITLINDFDTTRSETGGPWPLSRFMALQASGALDEWTDRADELTPAIAADHPQQSGDFDTFARAAALVGNRHGDAALTALVNHLLREIDRLTELAEKIAVQLMDEE